MSEQQKTADVHKAPQTSNGHSKAGGVYRPRFASKAGSVHSDLAAHMLADGFPIVLDSENSKGSFLTDALSGTKYLDFFTCFASMPIGLNHPGLTDPAFVQYLGKASINKPSNSDLYTCELATFVNTFFNLAVPEHFKYGFFIEGGTLAVENALKTAFDWKVRRNFAKGYKFERGHAVMHFRQAFHGRSGYTMSLTNTDENKVRYFPKFTDWPRISNPAVRFPLNEANLADVMAREKAAVAEMEQVFFERKDEIAAIIIEPIQGEGGDNHFRPEFLGELRRLADENDALLIFDEVQTGVGITGAMWAHQKLGVNPDIMAFGKKMQVCGIIVSERVDSVPDNVFHKSSRINSTWGGNLTDMVRATRYLELIDEEKMVANAAEQGVYLQEQLGKLAERFPTLVGNPRGLGLFAALDLPDAETRARFQEACKKRGLMMIASGTKSMRFRPPLNISRDEINLGMNIITEVLEKLDA